MELKKFAIKLGNYFRKAVGIDDIYTIAIRKKTDFSLFEGDFSPFTAIPYSKKYWYADPILIANESGTYLFAEAYDRKNSIGHISVAAISNEGEIGELKIIISEPYHMSFPSVFEWRKEYYMIPETCKNGSINLYKAEKFPNDWRLVKSWQVGKKFVDSVLIGTSESSLQFLASEVDPENLLRCRYAMYSLVGLDDINSCSLVMDKSYNDRQKFNYDDRNAGAIIQVKDGQILPTQSSTTTEYGVSLFFRNKQKLAKDNSPEIKPKDIRISGINEKKFLGVHSYAQNDQFEIIDMRYLKYCPESVLYRIRKKFALKKHQNMKELQ